MGYIIKILRNVSGSTKNILNRQLSNNESYTVPYGQWAKAVDENLLINDITNGLIIVNDGTSDLSPSNGIDHLKKYYIDTAEQTPFDNSSNGFTSTNAQDAIEEAKSTATGLSRYTITCVFNSSIGNNNWLGYSELLPGNQVPIRIAVKSKIREITFSYNQSNILGIPLSSENVDGTFKLYKNGLTDPTHVVATIAFVNQPGGKIVTGLNISLNSGDFIVGRWTDQGDNPSDMAIVYHFEPVV